MKLPPAVLAVLVAALTLLCAAPTAEADAGTTETSGTDTSDSGTADPLDTEEDDEADGYWLMGYVYEASPTGVTALADVGVDVYILTGKEYKPAGTTALTDENGLFKIEMTATAGVYISFSKDGYEVRQTPATMKNPSAADMYRVDLPAETEEGGAKVCWVTDNMKTYVGDSSAAQKVLMGSATTVVTVNVSYGDGDDVKNARVRLDSVSSDRSYTGYTDEDGICTFDGVAVGRYNVTVERSGFYDYEVRNVDVSEPIKAVLEEAPVEDVFGMSIVHLLMIVGAVLGSALAMSAYVLYRRTHIRFEVDASGKI